ncbi:MAG: PEP-CTERM sorting domain-containing protein [Pirellulaceae bacterium]|nr:PEP-CTERM sorting domain-containing protein [Pirellulaceae bacterium]
MMRLFSAHGSTVTATRPLGTSIIADSGDTWYISFAAQKNTDYSTPWAFMGLTNTSGISAARIRAGFNGISPDNRIAAAIGCRDAFGTESNTVNSTDALANEPVFYVLKIDTTTDGTLNLSMNYYFQNETLPIDEPTSWALQTSQSGMSGVSYDIAYIQGRSGVNYGGTGAFFDEFRLGTTWQDVAAEVPEPSTFALLGMGLFGLLAYAWRKRR